MVMQLTDVSSKKLRNWIGLRHNTCKDNLNDYLVFPMTVKVNWDRNPVSVHSDDATALNHCINYLRNRHGLGKHSVVMRQSGWRLHFLLYEACDPLWISEFQKQGNNMGKRQTIPLPSSPLSLM